MKAHNDASWNRVLERMDCEMDDLADAEARLRMGSDAPLGREWVEELVAKATVVPVAAAPVRLPRVRLWASVAAVLLAAVLIANWRSFSWSSGTFSQKTMTYAMAIDLLGAPDQPPKQRHSALLQADEWVEFGVRTLRSIRDAGSPGLATSAGLHLSRLSDLLASDAAAEPASVRESMKDVAQLANDSRRPLDKRLQDVHRLADLTASGILAIRGAKALSKVAEKDQLRVLKVLRDLLEE